MYDGNAVWTECQGKKATMDLVRFLRDNQCQEASRNLDAIFDEP